MSEPLRPESVHIFSVYLLEGKRRIPGSIIYHPKERSIGFSPLQPLQPGTKYIFALTDELSSPGGKPLTGATAWSFRTEDSGAGSDSGTGADGVHLHLEIRRWPKSVTEAEDKDKAKEDVLKKTSFFKLECVNINPPKQGSGGDYASWLKKNKNIDLDAEWGDADYWEINWTQVSYMSGGLPKDYNKTYCASPWGLGFECIKQGNCHWCPWKKE